MSTSFSGPHLKSSIEGSPRQVPGFESLHRMTRQLLREGTGPQGTILVLGAGGGLELEAAGFTGAERFCQGLGISGFVSYAA